MKATRITQILLSLIAGLLGWLIVRPNPMATVHAANVAVQYKVVAIQGGDMEQQLNNLGKDGWRLVTCPNGFGYCIFESGGLAADRAANSVNPPRPLPNPPTVDAAELHPSAPTPDLGPKLIAPNDGAVFNNFPRTTSLEWKPVAGAVSYTVEIQFGNLPDEWNDWKVQPGIATTSYTFDFVGKNSGRWRVWATFQDGHEGDKSAWRVFTYTK